MNWRDVVVRAAKTAAQTFIVAAPATVFVQDDPMPILYAAAISAGAAAVAVVWNALLQWSKT